MEPRQRRKIEPIELVYDMRNGIVMSIELAIVELNCAYGSNGPNYGTMEPSVRNMDSGRKP
jgi:hypothetical protein